MNSAVPVVYNSKFCYCIFIGQTNSFLMRNNYFSFTVLSIRYIYRTYNDKGKCTPIGGAHRSSSLRTHNLQKPSRLYWDITPKLAEIIENAVRFAQKVTDFIILSLSVLQLVIAFFSRVAIGFRNTFTLNFLYLVK